MKLYHGTPEWNVSEILRDGLKATALIDHPKVPRYVYATDNLEIARRYGDDIFEMDTDDFEESGWGTYEETIGVIYHHEGDISPDKIKLLTNK